MRAGIAVAALFAWAAFAAPASAQLPQPLPASCPTTPDASRLPDAAGLKEMNRIIAKGSRPTGSKNHVRYINWIRRELRKIDGVQIEETPFTISRFTPSTTRVKLRVGKKIRNLDVASPVPYSRPTDEARRRRPDRRARRTTSRSRRRTRRARSSSATRPRAAIAHAAFLLPVVSWSIVRPEQHDRPGRQLPGRLHQLQRAASPTCATPGRPAPAASSSTRTCPTPRSRATTSPTRDRAGRRPPPSWAPTRARSSSTPRSRAHPRGSPCARPSRRSRRPTLTATIPGQSPQRLVVDSPHGRHERRRGQRPGRDGRDGALPGRAARRVPPAHLQFKFVTGHFYQRLVDPNKRHGGVGCRGRAARPRLRPGDGLGRGGARAPRARSPTRPCRAATAVPGFVLEQNGLREIQFVAVTPSPPLVRHGRGRRRQVRHAAHDHPPGRRRARPDGALALLVRRGGDPLQPEGPADGRGDRGPADALQPALRARGDRLRGHARRDDRLHGAAPADGRR